MKQWMPKRFSVQNLRNAINQKINGFLLQWTLGLKVKSPSTTPEGDGLAEKFIAQGGILETVNQPIVPIYDEEMIRVRIDEFRNIVTSAINTDPRMASIVDGITDLQEIVDSKLYKFKLQ